MWGTLGRSNPPSYKLACVYSKNDGSAHKASCLLFSRHTSSLTNLFLLPSPPLPSRLLQRSWKNSKEAYHGLDPNTDLECTLRRFTTCRVLMRSPNMKTMATQVTGKQTRRWTVISGTSSSTMCQVTLLP